jgi:hypothetical protein
MNPFGWRAETDVRLRRTPESLEIVMRQHLVPKTASGKVVSVVASLVLIGWLIAIPLLSGEPFAILLILLVFLPFIGPLLYASRQSQRIVVKPDTLVIEQVFPGWTRRRSFALQGRPTLEARGFYADSTEDYWSWTLASMGITSGPLAILSDGKPFRFGVRIGHDQAVESPKP